MDMDRAVLLQVIRTTILRRGRGIDNDPVRIITQYWATDGELLAEVDPCPGLRSTQDDIIDQMKRSLV